MICYLVRHGKDDDSVRGGWSASALTAKGIRQAEQLSADILSAGNLNIGMIYSSDLPRAMQTADILSRALSVPIIQLPEFRETNNGVLAGMDNRTASEKYPGLYWSALDWDQPYPGGESPHQFCSRIADAWCVFKQAVSHTGHNVILVTHGGVINVIQCIENGIPYSNKANPFPLRHAQMTAIELFPRRIVRAL